MSVLRLTGAFPQGLVGLPAPDRGHHFRLLLLLELIEHGLADLQHLLAAQADQPRFDLVPQPGSPERLHLAGPHERHDLVRQGQPRPDLLQRLEPLLNGRRLGDDGDERPFVLTRPGVYEEALVEDGEAYNQDFRGVDDPRYFVQVESVVVHTRQFYRQPSARVKRRRGPWRAPEAPPASAARPLSRSLPAPSRSPPPSPPARPAPGHTGSGPDGTLASRRPPTRTPGRGGRSVRPHCPLSPGRS